MDYLREHAQGNRQQTKFCDQKAPIPNSNQVANNAGGFTFAQDKWGRLARFLLLGTESGSYYCSEKKLTVDNAQIVEQCIKEDGIRVVNQAVKVSFEGQAPKNDPAIFVLALAASKGNQETRKYALSQLSKVCRIGTHLFHFAHYVNGFRGWGRSLKRAVASWYSDRPLDDLAYQLVKYKQRDGWSHRDLLRLAHPHPRKGIERSLSSPIEGHGTARELLYRKVTQPKNTSLVDLTFGDEWTKKEVQAHELFNAAVVLSTETDEQKAVELLRRYNLPREVINTQLLNNRNIWDTLLWEMPLNALVRNLGKMTAIGLLSPNSRQSNHVTLKLSDRGLIRKSRLHPIALLSALKIYNQGHGERGNLSWSVNRDIVDALGEAFYLAFDNVRPTNKRLLLAVDVSGSMDGNVVAGLSHLNARTVAAAMAMVTAKVERNRFIKGFTSTGWGYRSTTPSIDTYNTNGLTDLAISPKMNLDSIVQYMQGLPMGGTDCALPIAWALKTKTPVDAFIVYTDNETWAGAVHPCQALKIYRERMGIPAKLIVVGVTANEFSIADPNDAGALDVVGFSTDVPQLISDFIGYADDAQVKAA